MKKKPFPETSRSAYESVSKEMIQNHHGKIISAIKKIGSGNYEQIAGIVNLEPHAVGRRLKELEQEKIICKLGSRSLTKSGRSAFNYTLTIAGSPKTEIQEKSLKGKSISEYSKSISKISQQVKQESLFE